MYCKAGVACTNPEVYGDIKRGRRLAPSKGIVCPRCQGKCCNEACLEKHKCKQRARPSSSVGGMRVAQHARWQGLEAGAFDPTGGLLDPNMAMALARAGQGGLLLPQGAQQYPQGFMLGTGEGGNMMPVIPILPFPLMFNAAALQQAGAEGGGLGAAELQAALAAAGVMQASGGAGGLSAPMMLAPMGNPGTEDAAASVSQALQLAQLQQLQAAGLGAGPLLQLTVQPDGSTGLVQAGSNQRLAMPQGLMQGMPLQLPGGLQFLSAEQLQMAADGSGSMPLMQVMADGTAGAMDQATVDAVAAAAAAGGLGGGLMAGLTAMGANLNALAGVSGSEAQALLEQQQQLELNAAAAAAVAAAAEGLPPGMAEGVDQAVANEAVAAAAAAAAAAAGAEAGMQGVAYSEGDPNAHAAALAASEGADPAQQQAAAAAAAAAHEHGDAPVSADGVPASGVHALAGADPSGLMLPAIPPLQMAPALAAALTATNGVRGLYNAEEDTAAAALMSLATDKKNKAAAAAAAAHAAAMAAESGIIPQAMAAQALEEARLLQAEAEAEAEAEAAKAAAGQLEQQQQQPQQDQLQAHQRDPTAAGAAGDDAVKQEYGMSAEEQLQQLHMQLLQQQQLQQLMQQQAQHEAEQQQVQLKYEQEQHHLAAQQQAVQSEGMEHQVNQQQQ